MVGVGTGLRQNRAEARPRRVSTVADLTTGAGGKPLGSGALKELPACELGEQPRQGVVLLREADHADENCPLPPPALVFMEGSWVGQHGSLSSNALLHKQPSAQECGSSVVS